jgi:hypothetical protein
LYFCFVKITFYKPILYVMSNVRRFFAIVLMTSLSITFANAQKTEKHNNANGLAPKHVLANTKNLKAEVSPNKKPFSPIHGQKAVWDILYSYNVGATAEAGIETDGNFIYTSKWSTAMFYKYSMTGTLLDSFSITSVTGIRDLAYDGTYFYGGANAATIYKMDFVNHTLIGTIACPTGTTVRNIAYDPLLGGLWVGGWDTDIKCISPTGTVLGTILATDHLLTGIYGSAYDSWTPGGPYLWLFDQGANGDGAFFNQISLTTMQPTGFIHDCSDISATALAGGAFCYNNAGTVTLGGIAQGELIFGYELLANLAIGHCDIAPSLLIAPLNSDTLTTSNPITVKVINHDTIDHFDIPISYVIDGGAAVNDTITDTIQGGSYKNFTFQQTYDFSLPGHLYNIEIYTSFGCDTINTNDTLETSVTNFWDVTSVSIDENPTVGPGSMDPKATFKNLGTIATTFDATMIIPGGYSSTKTITALAPGSSQQVTFDPWLAAIGNYTIEVYTTLLADSLHSNDTLTQSISVVYLTKAYCYVAYDPTSTLPEGPAVTSLEVPAMITSLADNTGQNFVTAGTWGRGNKWYGFEADANNLITFDTVTGARTVIGNVGIAVNGMAYDYSTNKIYGVASSGSDSKLYSISPVTGASSLIGTSSPDMLINLACDTFGNLYSIGINDDLLYSVNKYTGLATSIGPIGFDASYAQDMEFDRYTNTCYLAGYDAATSAGDLSFVNTTTGATTLIGAFAGGSEITGFAIPYNSPLPANDASIASYTSPESACGLGTEAITITIDNLGTTSMSGFPVSYKINGGAAVTETVSATILAGASLSYTFSQSANLSTPGTFTIKAYTSLTNDEYPSNDTIIFTVENLSNSIPPYSMGFEPTENFAGWVIEDSNADDYTWTIQSTGGNTNPYVAQYSYNSSSAANDWLISKCIMFDASKTYKLSYSYMAHSASYPESMSVYIGTSPVSTSMTTLLADHPSIVDVSFIEASVNFTVPTSGVYYLGWLCNSAADMYDLYLDDINISDVTGISDVSENPGISVYPNPATNLLNMKSGSIMNNVKIYNSFGQLVISNDIKALNYKLNTESLSEGLYFIYIETAEGVSVSKITINK